MTIATVIAALAGAVAVACGLAALGYRSRWRAAVDRLDRIETDLAAHQALLRAAPVGAFSFAGPVAGASAPLGDLLDLDPDTADFERVCHSFRRPDRARLEEAVRRLKADGSPFRMTLANGGQDRHLAVWGAAGAPGPTVWFADVSRIEADRAAVAAERDLLTAAFERLPLPVWRRDAELDLCACNAAYARAVDAAPEQVVDEGAELLGRARGEAGRRLAARARETNAPAGERHHVVAEGKRRLMEIVELPLPGAGDGRSPGLLGVALDRTEVEDLQNELARHVSAHAEVLESLSTAIAIFSADLRVKFYNGAYVELWGLDEAFLDAEPHVTEVLEKLRELRQLPEQSDFRAYKHEVVEQLRSLVRAEEDLVHRPDGTTLRTTLSPHPFGGVLATYEDVTDRLALERSFNTMIEVQRETIENLYEAVAVFGSDGRLALYNQAYVGLWSLPMDELGDRPHLRDLVPEARDYFDVPERHWPHLMERIVARATEPEAGSGRIERTDGMVVDWAQVPLPDGQSLFTYLNVTDSIRVERALRQQAEALETADRLKSEFIANISYELRTPLNAIVGFAEILDNEYFGRLNDRQREYAQAIVESSQRLIGLINDILDLATIEAGYLRLDTEEVDVQALLGDLQILARERAHSRNVALTVDCPSEVGALTADPRRLKQALFNLVSNAFNFTPEGGRVTLTAERGADADGVPEMRLGVVDTGVGIPKEDQARVFTKFVRGQPRNSGAGLGLSLVKSLIELHGGHVELHSVPNEGTRVTCRLPLDADRARRDGGPRPAA
jgi:signal transduction histidine kinase